MPTERGDEARARHHVEQWAGLNFSHEDTGKVPSMVDYKSPDGTKALEVTRFTNGLIRRARDGHRKSNRRSVTSTQLRSCWFLDVHEAHPTTKNLAFRALPYLIELDGAPDVELAPIAHRTSNADDASSAAYKNLRSLGIDGARPFPALAEPKREHTHAVMLSFWGGGSAASSDDALERLESTVLSLPDNIRKLNGTQSRERHLFVWVDEDTIFAVERPLRERAGTADVSFGLPTRPPGLDPAVTHLWVVHESSGNGWLWDGAAWHSVTV